MQEAAVAYHNFVVGWAPTVNLPVDGHVEQVSVWPAVVASVLATVPDPGAREHIYRTVFADDLAGRSVLNALLQTRYGTRDLLAAEAGDTYVVMLTRGGGRMAWAGALAAHSGSFSLARHLGHASYADMTLAHSFAKRARTEHAHHARRSAARPSPCARPKSGQELHVCTWTRPQTPPTSCSKSSAIG